MDLSGQHYGKLTVLGITDNPNSKSKKRFWDCLCECGNNTVANTTDLLSGRKYQCSKCSHKASGMAKRKDITGQRFGKLVVQKMVYGERTASGRQRTYVVCQCDCGNIVKRSPDRLVSHRWELYSCGCARKEIAGKRSKDILGNRFGRLTVIKEISSVTPRKVVCQCDCGNIIEVVKTDIMSHHTLSCGCMQSERASERNTKNWAGTISPFGIKFVDQAYQTKRGVWMWICECFCGEQFIALPAEVMSGKICSCGCVSSSRGELLVSNILDSLDMTYTTEVSFQDCKDIFPLRFDFAIPGKNNLKLIEYDGPQHFMPVDYFGGEQSYKTLTKHDHMKNKFCKNKNIPLLRLKYSLSDEEIKKRIIEFIAL